MQTLAAVWCRWTLIYPDSGGSQEDSSTQRPASASSPTSTAASTRWLDWKPKFETFSTGDLWIHVAELPSEFLRSPLQVSIGRKQVSIKKSSFILTMVLFQLIFLNQISLYIVEIFRLTALIKNSKNLHNSYSKCRIFMVKMFYIYLPIRLPMLMILSFFAAPQTLLVPDIGSTVAGATFL